MVACLTYRWNLGRDIDLLDKLLLSLKGAFQVGIGLDFVAEVSIGFDQFNQTVFDLEVDLGPFFDRFVEDSFGLDGERLATVNKTQVSFRSMR